MAKKNFSERVEQGKQIAKALTTPLPEAEKWFQDRLATCNGCEWNTKNKPYEEGELSLLERVGKGIKDKVCESKNYCRACGCCIELKASLMESTCGLVELENPQEPKWIAIETKSPIDDNISIINLSPKAGKTSTETSNIIYDFGTTNMKKLTARFQIKRKGGFNFKTFTVGCSCTAANPKVIDKETVEFSVDISTLSFRKGLTKRTMSVSYYETPNVLKAVSVMFKVTMDGK